MKLTEIEFSKLERWGWECPDCGKWNEDEEDPYSEEHVLCDGCGEYFKINE